MNTSAAAHSVSLSPGLWPAESAAIAISSEAPGDIPARDRLLDRAMAPNWRRKSSEKIRRGRQAALAFVARDEAGAVVGTVRLWDIEIGTGGRRALLLGPLAVDPTIRSGGIGSALIRNALAEAQRAGIAAVVLVGDAPYYGRFGFSAARTAEMAMPGPFEKHRLLAIELVPGALDDARGVIRPAGRRIDRAA